ncbi:MAG: dUTP diphosphatase [Candidatus Adiutrix sp.]
MRLLFKRVRPLADADLPLPARKSPEAAGLDLAAGVTEATTIDPGKIVLIPTGWAMAIDIGYEGQIRPRSGLALKLGLTLINTPGTIDSDYRGEILLPMINLGQNPVTIKRGDRIAQLIINKIELPEIILVENLNETERGDGGFGSSGV